MAIIAENNGQGGNFTPIEAGTYCARCYSMVHIGTSEEDVQGQKKMQNKVRITWELPTELKVFKEENGEQPHVVSKDFTLSMHEKSSLRKFLQTWRGKEFTENEAKAFDITALLGKECMLSIIHKTSKTGKVYVDIAGVSTLIKGMVCPPQINPSYEFSVADFDIVKFNAMPTWLQDKIKKTEEYKKVENAFNSAEFEKETKGFDAAKGDDLPF
jgi:hypothetical protein